jgi:hypothetical protein
LGARIGENAIAFSGSRQLYRYLYEKGSKEVQIILLSREEVARCATELYENSIRQQVETEENIGKMVIIDIETGEYAVDKIGTDAAHLLRQKNPLARLFGIRIGYKVAASFSGEMERD